MSLYHPASMPRPSIILIIVIAVFALLVDFAPRFGPQQLLSRPIETKLGLDLSGGLRVEYQAQQVEDRVPTAADLAVIQNIVERRVNATGVSEPVVTTQGTDRVVVELPGVSDPESVRRLVGQTGRLDFVPIPGGQQPPAKDTRIDFPPLFSGEMVSNATLGQDQQGGIAVNFQLNDEGARIFSDHTRNNTGSYFAITLDNVVISAPQITEAIPGNQVQITGGGSLGGLPRAEATNLVTVLQFGSLPFPLVELSNVEISATLGQEFVNRSILAGAIGILIVIIFMLLHYRLPGLVASGALLFYAILVYAIFRMIPVTLTLAGIAGFVLSVGMAVDANILIFERMKEELRLGKSLPAAVEAGFARAWNSILDSNVSSLITATILFVFGTSVIKGFALVLIIGVLVSMFTAITVTRAVMRVVVQQEWARKAGLYGVAENEFVARPIGRAALRGEARGRV